MCEKINNEIAARNEVESCVLCHNAECSKACPYGVDPAKIIRSIRFENKSGALKVLGDKGQCTKCKEKPCVPECVKRKFDRAIRIPELMEYFQSFSQNLSKDQFTDKVDLSIDFCGVKCENSFFLSSSVVASNYEMVAKAFDMGWAGVAFKTIGMFIPKEVSPRFSTLKNEGNSFAGFKNIEQISDHTFEENVEFITKLKKNYPTKIIVASILGQSEDEWTYLAKKMEEAGADIIECNFSCPHMSGEGMGSDVGQDPELVALFTAATRRGTTLPILAKMTPNIGNMEIPAIAAMKSGATGIAAINTIKSVMNIDIDSFVSGPQVDGKSCIGGYSGKAVKPIALRFIHDMKKHEALKDAPISGMGGIENWKDALEFIALGCGNLQITTAVMQYGYRIIEDLIEGMSAYLVEKGLKSIDQLVGIALPNIIMAEQLNRDSIVYPSFDRKKCIACGRCYLSCYDGGHQAISIDEDKNTPSLIPKKCVGCHLCKVVCPVGAISESKRQLGRNGGVV